jgi:hypothetical protein
MLPNFIIAGSMAGGTSFLSSMLSKHPDIYLPREQRPEPNFFHYTDNYNKGLDWYQKKWFSETKNQKAIGERSSLLLTSENAAMRLKNSIPDIKLIFVLRNPIERAWANYRFSVLEGYETLDFEEALDLENTRSKSYSGRLAEIQPNAYLKRSIYSDSLIDFMNLFGKDNILIVKSEELGMNTERVVEEILKFLNVDEKVKLPIPNNYTSPSVKNKTTQSQLRAYFGEKFPVIIERIREEKIAFDLFESESDHKKLQLLYDNLENSKLPLKNKTRLKLANLLEIELKRLEKILPFDISDWR